MHDKHFYVNNSNEQFQIIPHEKQEIQLRGKIGYIVMFLFSPAEDGPKF